MCIAQVVVQSAQKQKHNRLTVVMEMEAGSSPLKQEVREAGEKREMW